MPRTFSLILLATFLLGCPDDGDSPDSRPYRDAWRVVHEGRFDVLDDAGNAAITDLQIGLGLGYQNNFINQGDVLVEFDGPPDTIKIELRRFTSATDEAKAAADYARLQLWSYNMLLGAPLKPDDMDEGSRCGGADEDGLPDPWLDDCGVYVYYDGHDQQSRAGADIRITLPPDYRQHVGIATGDEVQEDSYPNRGNVCVTGLDATLDVELGSGLAFVALAPDTSPAPTCPAELRAECEAFDDPATDGPDAWAAGCGCIAQGYDFGHVHVKSRAPSPSTMTVDLPAALWTRFQTENSGTNEIAGKHCVANLDGFDDVTWLSNDPAAPWRRIGWLNQPPAALPTGFGVVLESHGCDPVAAVESPDEWSQNEDPPTELRGDLTLCAGCLASKSCNELLPGN